MNNRLQTIVSLLALTFLMVSCDSSDFRESKTFAGGIVVDADTLNIGKTAYMENCFACHGMKGDGDGVAGKGLNPPPRNFKQGIFKFGSVISGGLPTDKDLKDLIKNGLHGTAMLPWDIEETRLNAVVQYIKTFAPEVWEGKDKKLGEKIRMTKDPYGIAHKETAIRKGSEVYHIVAQCTACHRGYATKAELDEMNKRINDEPYEMEEDLYKIKLQEGEHTVVVNGKEKGVRNLPPDFLIHNVRSAQTVEELYVRLMAGVGGTSMPAWQDSLEDNEVWAVAHYVKYLMEMKTNQAARDKLIEKLK